ncbi:hypothetical protein [Rhabdothermincola sp.]|uniref:hypothetical protein n=1 Tax=Rhabdothermincola sp. TaxID=2820405 RepID=UPI002FE35278
MAFWWFLPAVALALTAVVALRLAHAIDREARELKRSLLTVRQASARGHQIARATQQSRRRADHVGDSLRQISAR